ncbi:lipopolysaccharide biosynthesis protein [Myroides odoratimimus]|uniref:lipopolysaccharide biosynthesis protein n=1 Tax=Myroides odoratimimus TaxID=76832 RepID=UPI0038D419AB
MGNMGLLKKTMIYGIGSLGAKIMSFLLVPLYSFYIKAEDFGYFDIVITTMSLIVPFVSLQLSDSVFRWLITSDKDDNIVKKVVSNTIMFLLVCSGVIFSVFLLLYYLYPLKNHWILFILLYSSMVYPFFQQIIRGLGYHKLYAFNGVVYTFAFIFFNVLFLVGMELDYSYLFVSTILSIIISSFHLIFRCNFFRYYSKNSVDLSYLYEMIKYAIPLIPNSISWWLINYSSKYFIIIYLGLSASGLFAMANRFPIIMVLISQIFTLAWQEEAIINFKEEDGKIAEYDNDVLKGLIKVQFVLVALLSLISQFLVREFLAVDYFDSWRYMPFLYLSGAFLSLASYYGAFYLSAKKTSSVLYTTIYSGLITVLGSFLLIKEYQIYGVCFSVMLGYIFLFFVRVYDVKNIVVIKFPIKVFITYFTVVLVSLFIAFAELSILNFLMFICVNVFAFLDNRIEIISIFNKVVLYFKKEKNV